MKDDSGAQAVFTEPGSSASQNDGRRSDGCHCKDFLVVQEVADAVSAYSLVEMEDAPKLLKLPQSECPDYGYVFHDKWPKS